MDITDVGTDGTNDTISWDAVTDADGYRVTVEIDADATPQVTVPSKGRFWLIEAMGRGRSEHGLKWGKTKKSTASINVVLGSTVRASKNNQGIVPFDVTFGSTTTATSTSPPQPAQNPPTVSIDSPADGATITANDVAFYASAQDDEGVQRVELYVNDGFKRSEVDPPYGWGGGDGVPNLDLTGYQDGAITFKAIAYDVTGLTAQDEVSCTLSRTPSATPVFDGRATLMTALTGSTLAMGSGSNASQDPQIWGESPNTPSGLYFMRRSGVDDAEVVSDATYTKAYKFSIGQGSTNPYLTLNSDGRASGELTSERPITPGQTDWYADAYKIVSPWHMPTSSPFCVMSQYGYPTLSSPPLSVCLDNGGLGLDRHVGMIPTGQTLPQTITKPRFYTLANIQDKWLELVIGVTWQFDVNGTIEVWGRIRGVDSNFSLVYSDSTRPTNQYKQGQAFKTTVNDKHGLYLGRFAVGSIQENVVYHKGFSRWTTKADAIASMG